MLSSLTVAMARILFNLVNSEIHLYNFKQRVMNLAIIYTAKLMTRRPHNHGIDESVYCFLGFSFTSEDESDVVTASIFFLVYANRPP